MNNYELLIFLIDVNVDYVTMKLEDYESDAEAIFHCQLLYDANAMISKIQLYKDGTLIHQITNPIYSWSNNPETW